MAVALLTVDLQRDFLEPGNDRPVASVEKAYCLEGAQRLIAHARRNSWRVVHVVTEHIDRTTLPIRLQSGPLFCVRGTVGQQLMPGVEKAGDLMVPKRSFSGFLGTRLAEELDGVTDIVIAGVATDCCLKQTAFDASERYRKRVYIPVESTSASTRDGYVQGLHTLAKAVAWVLALRDIEEIVPAKWQDRALDAETLTRHATDWFNSETMKRASNGTGQVTFPYRPPTRSGLPGQS